MTRDQTIEMIMRHEGPHYHQNKFTNYFTKYGISSRAHPQTDIRNLTPEHAIEIHKRDWYSHKIDNLPENIAGIIFTAGIMLGFPEAFRFLSQAVDYFPLREELTNELESKTLSSNDLLVRARIGSLVILWFSDHYKSEFIRSVVPRILESVSI